jgi:hypothetical protein
MSMMKILAAGLLIPIVLLVIPNVYASESNDKRYSDGYSNGSDAASRSTVYDVTCDPNNQFTSGGGHSTTYCNGWTNGYNAEWNNAHQQQSSVGPIIGQSQSPGALAQGQGQGSSNTCINVVNCNPSTNQKQGATGEVNNGQ